MTRIELRYYAQLREQAGRSGQTLVTDAPTLAALYEQLRAQYGFALPASALKVAVNTEFCDWQQPLRDGDVVVFIPPVNGG